MYRLNVTSKENNLTGNGYYSLQSLCRHRNYEGITRVKDDTCKTQKWESMLSLHKSDQWGGQSDLEFVYSIAIVSPGKDRG